MRDETSWSLVEGAAGGDGRAREAFGRLYLPVVEAYLRHRWAHSPLVGRVDDAVQDVFLELIKPNGALGRVRRDHGAAGFRAFLYGVARNVARRHEEGADRQRRREQALPSFPPVAAEDPSPSAAFDRAWARALMRATWARLEALAADGGDEERRNVELLRLRFQDGLPIREIAARWEADPAAVHRRYRRARRAYADALYATVAPHVAGTPADVRRECARLLDLLR